MSLTSKEIIKLSRGAMSMEAVFSFPLWEGQEAAHQDHVTNGSTPAMPLTFTLLEA
jgi:hypothetical protein